ncbi:hypothetical protein FGG08_002101 [Glutinoglossum americanum]|uniref:Metallo-beta-lactamase domain-containing protein n=1 Tax=Glutinoglossum americanum TaxID=1670608 RepID=A0A9P8I0P8_9PEZI|nr:hypothetical protein FGG08_002101 [Glutinoglossum americanum]
MPDKPASLPTTCFTCTRLNPTTFRICEDDQWDQLPFVYAKIYDSPALLVLIDTGCGGAARDDRVSLKSLREFIETYPVEANGWEPLNARDHEGKAKREYLIICTHCHYDHIGGIAQFTDTPSTRVVSSSLSPSFITSDLPTTSLCRFVGMPTPTYTVSHWATDNESLTHNDHPLDLHILHTPGHTPDSLAIWDSRERCLFVGDTLYERAPITFSKEGDIVQYMASLERLLSFLGTENKDCDAGLPRARAACGHETDAADGEEIVGAAIERVWEILDGHAFLEDSFTEREEIYDRWGAARLTVLAPRRLVDDARRHFKTGGAAS